MEKGEYRGEKRKRGKKLTAGGNEREERGLEKAQKMNVLEGR